MSLTVIILAAGKGTRMRSSIPKVLHPLAGTPLVEHVVYTAQHLNPDKILVVYGHGGERVPTSLGHLKVEWVEQKEQLGTGHAVMEALGALDHGDEILVLYGDVPLISYPTLNSLLNLLKSKDAGVALLTAELSDPSGYGRIVRNAEHAVTRIVEQKDASESELTINEVNTGILAVKFNDLKGWLDRLENKNAQQEYYLTDIIGMSVADGKQVYTSVVQHIWEMLGVNNKLQLAELERRYQLNVAEQLMLDGVTLADPARIDVRGSLHTGRDIFIDVNCVFEGEVHLADDVSIGPGCLLKNCRIGAGTIIHANTVMEDAVLEEKCEIGPFARIRPDTYLHNKAKVGNFVELKKSSVGVGSKINHLSYVGDSDVGSNVNIGAGTITCNYDGAFKHKTIIEDDVFVGSDTQLIAPVKIGKGTTIGAGSTITKDTPEGKLSLSRSKQLSIDNWQRPVKKKS